MLEYPQVECSFHLRVSNALHSPGSNFFFFTGGDKPHSTETTFHFRGFVDNFSKSSELCLTAAVMAPLTPPGPFNLVTAQRANECFI